MMAQRVYEADEFKYAVITPQAYLDIYRDKERRLEPDLLLNTFEKNGGITVNKVMFLPADLETK